MEDERGMSGCGGSALWLAMCGILLFVFAAFLIANAIGTPAQRAAARERAEQARAYARRQAEIAEAEAYRIRKEADTQAAAERAALREAAREAAHQRTLETLPHLVLIFGALGLTGFVSFIVWDLRSQRQAEWRRQDTTLTTLEVMRREQRQMWQQVARWQREGLLPPDKPP